MNTKKLLIDGDFILWKTVPNISPTATEKMYNVSFEKTLQETLDLVDWYIEEKIFKPTDSRSYIAFLGGDKNFRKDLNSQYKINRIDKEFPNYFKEAKQYLIDKWNFIKVDDIEAEDAVGICLTEYPDSIVVREDHDLDQLPGLHYNPTKEIFTEIKI